MPNREKTGNFDSNPALETSFLMEVLRWSALTAAFIGPGTVTTAARAGAELQYTLIPVVVAAVAVCIFLQYQVALITRKTQKTLPEMLETLPGGKVPAFIVKAGIIFGCAAFQAGNLTGAATGFNLMTGVSTTPVTVAFAVIALAILQNGSQDGLRNVLGFFVALMSLFFIGLAVFVSTSHQLPPAAPPTGYSENMLYLALALFGTTIVPYNIFLGSSIARSAADKRLLSALVISIGLGGLITVSILACGPLIQGTFSFSLFHSKLSEEAGWLGGAALASGLISAGFSSALTAPYAAGLLFSESAPLRRWIPALVIVTGTLLALSGGAPASVIIAAQTANAIVLPLALAAVTRFLFLYSDARKLAPFTSAALTVFFSLLAIRWIWVKLISLSA